MSAVKLIKQVERRLPQVEYLTVTPEQAQLWLDGPSRNRKLLRARVDAYAEAMKRGDWMLTNQGIAFDEQGSLIDGQHRLHAVVKADVSVDMLVVRSVANRSQLVLDQGTRRGAHDQIGLREGWQVYPVHTATAKAMIESVGGAMHTERRAIARDIQLLSRFYVKHHKAIEFAVTSMWTKHGSVKGVVVAPSMAPIARAYYTVDQTMLARFCDVLATGMADSPGDGPIVVLRNWLITGRERELSSRKGRDRFIIYKKTEIALRAFLDGDGIQRLGSMSLSAELFPLPEEKVARVRAGK